MVYDGTAVQISIHAPHAGSDLTRRPRPAKGGEFQSTLPMRGATNTLIGVIVRALFQSTLPMRGATASAIASNVIPSISIHAPHAGSDPPKLRTLDLQREISIHAPHAGSDLKYEVAE